MSLTHLNAIDGVAPGRGYSHVVCASGRIVAVSGQVALDEQGELRGGGDAGAQARQAFQNLQRCLAAADATLDDVVKLTYFVTEPGLLPAVAAARDEMVDTTHPPASTFVQVAGLARPDLLVEIEAIAVIPE
jgi:enamine deaminase RidA (YjgF/YER057c/UK114 family)